jgi:hypothetical protein
MKKVTLDDTNVYAYLDDYLPGWGTGRIDYRSLHINLGIRLGKLLENESEDRESEELVWLLRLVEEAPGSRYTSKPLANCQIGWIDLWRAVGLRAETESRASLENAVWEVLGRGIELTSLSMKGPN